MWGLPYFMIRVAVRQLDPGTLVLARTLPAALVLLPLAAQKGTLASLRGKFRWVLLYTVIEFGVPWLIMSNAERRLASSVTSLIVCATPLFALGITRFTPHHERIEPRRWLGLAIGTLGVALLVGLSFGRINTLAMLSMLIVAFGYAAGPLVLRYQLHDSSGLAVVAVSTAVVAVGYAPWGVTHWPHHVLAATWGAIGVLAAVCTAGAFLIFFALIQEVGPQRAVVVTYLNTAMAVILGVLFLHESLTIGIILGFPLIVAGSAMATARRT
jgi:drug/metabolite transporter (DMT)-like permease